MNVQRLITAEELEKFPKANRRHELVRGKLKTMTPAGFDHCMIGNELSFVLNQYVRPRKLGKIVGADAGFRIAKEPDTVRVPDVAFVVQSRIDAVGRTKRFWDGPPDLAAEVMSPNDTVSEVSAKAQEWIDAGARLVWVINPDQRTATVFRPDIAPLMVTEDQTLEGFDVVPGFSYSIKKLLDLDESQP